jgi:hypothetical protein
MRSESKTFGRWNRRIFSVALLMLCAVCLQGCAAVAILAHMVLGPQKEVKVVAQYRDLSKKKVALVTIAHDRISKQIPVNLSKSVQKSLIKVKDEIPGITLLSQGKVEQFKKKNPHWQTPAVTPEDWLKGLGVQRLVMIDLTEFRTHDEGNINVLRGRAAGTVAVYQVEDADPNQPIYFNNEIQIRFPEKAKVGGVPGPNPKAEKKIREGLYSKLSEEVAGLFYDHTKWVDR